MFDKKYQLLTLQRQRRLICRHTNEGSGDQYWDVVAGDAAVGKSVVMCWGRDRFFMFGLGWPELCIKSCRSDEGCGSANGEIVMAKRN